MPTFPTYPGELPSCLNPLNMRHYFLLAYWVFFRPTALKCYMYQADPDLYRAGPGLSIFRTVLVPAYRNLYLVALGTTFGGTAFVGVPIVLLMSGFQSNWAEMALGTALGVVLGVVLGVPSGVVLGAPSGVVFGVVLGVVLGVPSGVVFGMSAVSLEVFFVVLVLVGIALGVLFGMVPGVVYRVAINVGMLVICSVSFWVAYRVLDRHALDTYGVLKELVFVLDRDTSDTYGVLKELVFALLSIVFLIVFSGLFYGVFIGVGGVRLPIYLIQGGGLVRSPWRGQHPIWWDELAVLPFMQTQIAINQAWKQGQVAGLERLSQLAANPFQRWVLQRALYQRLHQSVSGLPFLYQVFTHIPQPPPIAAKYI